MELEKEKVQEFVDEAVRKYEEGSIFGNGVEVRSKESHRLPTSECREEATIGADALNSGTAFHSIRNQINTIIDCEEQKVINRLDGEADLKETITADEFAGDIFTQSIRSVPLSSDNRVLLPDYDEYRFQLENEYGVRDALPHNPRIPIYWFDPDIFSRRGFVVSSRVHVVQEEHGADWPIVNEDLDIGELDADNSENRLIIHLGNRGYHPIEVSLWTEFSDPQTIDDESVCKLSLPDPADV